MIVFINKNKDKRYEDYNWHGFPRRGEEAKERKNNNVVECILYD